MNKESLIAILEQTINVGIQKRKLPERIDPASSVARLMLHGLTIKTEM